jgi:hypothetical protein
MCSLLSLFNFHIIPFRMSLITSVDDIRSDISESELSETLNTTVFNITIYATISDLPDKDNMGDFVEMNGRIYITVSRTANYRAGFISSWI